MDILQIRDEVRAYLASHPKTQPEIAKELGVSSSWLNKFLNGHAPNLGAERLHELHEWVKRDRKRSSSRS
jgi:transcriptional regulator with XRE-family HTH domain